MNSLEAAYFALAQYFKKEIYLKQTFEKSAQVDDKSFLIAYGVLRRFEFLQAQVKQLLQDTKIKKTEAKILLYMALYMKHYMERYEDYVICNELVRVAKRFCPMLAKFLNFAIRKMLVLPLAQLSEEQTLCMNHDLYEVLRADYPEKYASLAQSYLVIPKLFARDRLHHETYPIDQSLSLKDALEKGYYIQNKTPIDLVEKLHEKTPAVQSALDLCAAPGGKSLLVKELYPNAALIANDLSEQKANKIQQNFDKHHIDAKITVCDALKYPEEQTFDLVILDAPCSNSGVFHKKPEAKHRFTLSSLKGNVELQKQLLQKAKALKAPNGVIWYMTCSILKQENEEVIAWAEKHLGLKKITNQVVLPSEAGIDGGYGCCLT